MTPLIDGDILLHELGWSGEFKDKETNERVLFNFEHVAELLDKKIQLIGVEVDATTDPLIFITNSEKIAQRRKRFNSTVPDFKPVFRYAIAETKPYKGNRKNPKPFHFDNIITHLDTNYDLVISEDGYEADDMMCMRQYSTAPGFEETIICSRDKDLRICPGWHYSWECGAQRSIGPVYTSAFGSLEKVGKKVLGYGKLFFYYQTLVGDSADHIPGCPGMGEAKAFNLLKDCSSEEEAFKLVKNEYLNVYGKKQAKERFLEQANLLWMVMEKGVGYEIPSN